MKYIMLFIILINSQAFAQNVPMNGLQTEGHDLKFASRLFQKETLFLELSGGAGLFAPTKDENQTVSGGFTFNSGFKKHFLSLGMHLGYNGNELPEFTNLRGNNDLSQVALIGYQYENQRMAFKMHFQPASFGQVMQNGSLPVTTIGFGCRF